MGHVLETRGHNSVLVFIVSHCGPLVMAAYLKHNELSAAVPAQPLQSDHFCFITVKKTCVALFLQRAAMKWPADTTAEGLSALSKSCNYTVSPFIFKAW